EQALRGGSDGAVTELLAVRLAWEVALLELFDARGLDRAWLIARARIAAPRAATPAEAALAVDLVLHAAYEKARQEELFGAIGARPARPARPDRPAVQAAFCIDVRAEVYRRALEGVAPGVETIGFAGFFGFPIELVPLGEGAGGAQCPALIAPRAVIAEEVPGAAHAGAWRRIRRQARRVWKGFKSGAVSCFSFVGPLGLLYAPKLVTDALGVTRPVPHRGSADLRRAWRARRRPSVTPATVDGRAVGLPLEAQVELAAGALRGMGLTQRAARLVLLAGHGARAVNNPHAAGLQCGACGGHSGDANARVAAAVLNDPEVRAALRVRGITLPADTVFVPGLHDTTTDEVTLFDLDQVPATHRDELARLERQLAEAGARSRAFRAPRLGLDAGEPVDAAVRARSRDWSEVRPEWGLAGCAAFIAAPWRSTAGLELGGRAFLHTYEHREDAGHRVLELILTAPVVVASWISLQYYGSAVAPRVFGSGNKTLHNVVGTVGVLEGNGGDLRVGLPWQSVHDGERLAHDPVRLTVVVAAPCEAMNEVIARHEHLRHLLDHGWLHLYAMDDEGTVTHRYTGGCTWQEVAGATASEEELAA
ncbi:MAG TPA: DUF2309 domain-containing protein, partial [Gemmatimonadales bacterium]|nr:DUF2309 domain-containing protein [Gemmatimonadales bacterium]